MTNFDALPNDTYLRLPQMIEMLSISKSSIYRACENGKLPKPVKLTERTSAWHLGTLRQCLNNKQLQAQVLE